MAKQLQKFFDLWSTQKYSKVSKICSACAGIFFRVTHMFKPTVSSDSLVVRALDFGPPGLNFVGCHPFQPFQEFSFVGLFSFVEAC